MYTKLFSALVIALSGLTGTVAFGQSCGGAEAPCSVAGGDYFAAVPEGADRAPMALFLHGYGGSGAAAIKNKSLVARFADRGYALISPSGQVEPSGAFRRDWAVDDGFSMPRDDVAFLQAVIDDAAGRFDLDRTRVLVTGFSRGGSMVWDLACAAPESANAFAAAAGGFWEPIQPNCTGPVHLYHMHGFADRLVPFEGRKVTFNGVDFHQGNIMKGLDIWRTDMACMGSAAVTIVPDGAMVKTWSDCTGGSLTLEMHTGGHRLPKGWVTRVLDWFEDTVQSD